MYTPRTVFEFVFPLIFETMLGLFVVFGLIGLIMLITESVIRILHARAQIRAMRERDEEGEND